MDDAIEKLTAMIQPLLEDSDMFITSILIKPTNNVKVFLDADGGLSIEKSAVVNRKLRHLIEETGLFPAEDYSLEVSSPGVDQPLVLKRQYLKNKGRNVLVSLNEGDKEISGILKEVNEDEIVLEQTDKKKKETTTTNVPFSEIKKTIVQIAF